MKATGPYWSVDTLVQVMAVLYFGTSQFTHTIQVKSIILGIGQSKIATVVPLCREATLKNMGKWSQG